MNNTIGGNSADDRNIISGNTTQGIFVTNFSAPTSGSTIIRNNYIGVAADGTTPMGNEMDGIWINGTSFNMIGGESGQDPAFSNIIANNGRNGVALSEGFENVVPYSNAILGNSIYGNASLGIDLGNNGRTANDADDSDDGPNKLQNFPVISDINFEEQSGQITISYTVPSDPANSGYPLRVEFFTGGTDNQGRTFIGADMFVENDFDTDKIIVITIGDELTVTGDTRLTATATDSESNTSEFSDGVAVISDDPAPGDEFTVSNTGDSGEGSLRWAIAQVNSGSGASRIVFDIPGDGPHVIQPQSQYDSFIRTVVLDGTTQPGYSAGTPVIVLDGSQAPDGTNGLVFTVQANESEVRGLAITGFKRQAEAPFSHGHAIILLGSDNRISGNFIGVMPDGSPMGNDGTGVLIQGSSGNHIGGRTPEDRNVISANMTGINVSGGDGGNLIEGNYVGTNPDGTEALGNRFNVQISTSSGNIIGGSEEGAGNVISGALMVDNSGGSGVVIVGSSTTSASDNIVAGNLIGTSADGTEAIPNMRGGVLLLFNANENIIGGTTESHRNVISGNGLFGVIKQGSALSPVTGNITAGNHIGLNTDGEPLPNGVGVFVVGAADRNWIGHSEYAKNVISGNSSQGIQINTPDSEADYAGNIIQNNYIGTSVDGQSASGNSNGILIYSPGNQIGGAGSNEGNLISGNNGYGIRVEGEIATGNFIQGNLIGTNADGTEAIGNFSSGITVRATDTMIGGDSPDHGNTIGGSTFTGITIYRLNDSEGRTTIQNNRIGIGADSKTPVGNGTAGVYILASSHNLIGGVPDNDTAFGNIIAHNGTSGVLLVPNQDDVNPYSNAILGNSIFNNGREGINLGLLRTPNDPDDSDDGPNKQQNFPEFSDLDFDVEDREFNITYSVPSAPGNSAYPLRVEFFLSDGDNQGRIFIGYDTFEESDFNTEKTIQLPLEPDITVNYRSAVTATATDSDMNTSQFADAVWAGIEIETVTVVRSITSSGTFSFNDEGQITGINISVDDLSGSGSLSVSLESAFAENFEWNGEGEIELAEIRWEIKAQDLAAGSFTVEFNLDEVSGLPEFENLAELVILKRDEPGSGMFEVLATTFDGNSLFVTISSFSEFTIGRVSGPVTVEDPVIEIPAAFNLHQNYPNPFNPTTNIRFDLPETSPVMLSVYSMTGQRVAILVNETKSAGSHIVTFDAARLGSGVYLYKLQAGTHRATSKMLLLK